MKTAIIALLCVLCTKMTFAQQGLLSFDEHNKYIYYQVVDVPGIAADTLHSRVLAFLKASYPKTKLKPNTNSDDITAQGRFLVYGGVVLIKNEKGEITYQLNIEFKDQKYRYWLTGFTFTPYLRDRYGNFVPKPGIEVPLEEVAAKFEKRDAVGYLDETGTFCRHVGDSLKQFILSAPKKEEVTRKVVTDKW